MIKGARWTLSKKTVGHRRGAERRREPGWLDAGEAHGLGESRRQGSSRWTWGMWVLLVVTHDGWHRWPGTHRCNMRDYLWAGWAAQRVPWPLLHLEPGTYPQWPGLKRYKPKLRLFCHFLHMVSLLHSSGRLFARDCSQCFSSDEHSAISSEPSPHNENKQPKQRPPVWYLSSWALYNDTCCLASKKKKKGEKKWTSNESVCVSAPQKVLRLHQRRWA